MTRLTRLTVVGEYPTWMKRADLLSKVGVTLAWLGIVVYAARMVVGW